MSERCPEVGVGSYRVKIPKRSPSKNISKPL
jgi:hypothetical protein